jgi:NACalpha-BTF3-like transcription factor
MMQIQFPAMPSFDVFTAGDKSGFMDAIGNAVSGIIKAPYDAKRLREELAKAQLENDRRREQKEQYELTKEFTVPKIKSELESRRLSNEKNKFDLDQRREVADLNRPTAEAKLRKLQQDANGELKPSQLSGTAKDAYSLYQLRNLRGENDPYYRMAKDSYDANLEYKKRQGYGTGGNEEFLLQDLVQKDNPGFTKDESYEASNIIRDGGNILSNGKKIKISPAARASMDRIVKSGTNTQGLNQQRYASTVESLIDTADDNAKVASRFSGVLGKSNLSVQQFKEQFGTSDPDYKKYVKFVTVDVPTIAGEFMRELGVNASDEQKRLYKEVVDPTAWNSDFDTALARWEYFKAINKNIAKSISKSPSEIQQHLRNNGSSKVNTADDVISNSINKKYGNKKTNKDMVNEENINYTMKQTGLPRDEVIRRLKQKGLL